MGYFSNGTEGMMYQEKYCFRCAYWDDDVGCPIWFLHELHVGESAWQATLDRLIPMTKKVKMAGGSFLRFPDECRTFLARTDNDREREAPMTPGQMRGLEEWKSSR